MEATAKTVTRQNNLSAITSQFKANNIGNHKGHLKIIQ
jgi:hypothetical protein